MIGFTMGSVTGAVLVILVIDGTTGAGRARRRSRAAS